MNSTTNNYMTKVLFLGHLIETAERLGKEKLTPESNVPTVLETARNDLDQATFWLYDSMNHHGLIPSAMVKRMKSLNNAEYYIQNCHNSIRRVMPMFLNGPAPDEL
jgi:hypothetical protein